MCKIFYYNRDNPAKILWLWWLKLIKRDKTGTPFPSTRYIRIALLERFILRSPKSETSQWMIKNGKTHHFHRNNKTCKPENCHPCKCSHYQMNWKMGHLLHQTAGQKPLLCQELWYFTRLQLLISNFTVVSFILYHVPTMKTW